MSCVDTFEHIIRQLSVHQLVPFLLAQDKKSLLAIRAKTKALRKELTGFRQLGMSTWGRTGTDAQLEMLFLAAVATYTRKEMTGLDHALGTYWGIGPERAVWQEYFLTVAGHARPNWLAEWFERRSRGGPWALPDYQLLREMEARQLINYEPALFARTLAHWLTQLGYGRRENRPVPDYSAQLLTELEKGAAAMQRDVLALFDYDTSVDSASAYTGVGQQYVGWAEVLVHLTTTGHLARPELLLRCLLALRRDFRRPLLTWFKNLFVVLQPTPDERLQWQLELVELLTHPMPLVVNFALEQLKSIWLALAFQAAPLLQYAEGLTTRQDLKTSLRTLLSGLEKMLKQQPAQAPAVARLAASALVNADNAVQERAAKLLVSLLGARKPLLSAAEAAEVTALAAQYADLLGAAARTALAPLLTDPASSAGTEAAEAYTPQQGGFVPELSAATAITPVRDWHELLFLTGPVLQHNDPVALERWLDGLLRLRRQFPPNYAELLQPYLLQGLPYLQHKGPADQAAALRNFYAFGHQGLVLALLGGWASGFTTPLVENVDIKHQGSPSDPLVQLEQQRLIEVERRVQASIELGLLSTPTHAPGWVAPTALVQRLLAHQAAAQEPHTADLALALARTAHAHAADSAAALALLPQVQQPALRELLGWFFSSGEQALPPIGKSKSLLHKFVDHLRWAVPKTVVWPEAEDALPWLWAVAARTKHPEARFDELRGVDEVPGTVEPWRPTWVLTPKSRTYVEQWKVGKPEKTERWVELEFTSAYTGKTPPPLLLYSQHTRFAGMLEAGWTLAADFPFLAAMLPNHPAPLYWHTVRATVARTSWGASSGEALSQALRHMIGPGLVFDEAATLLLALGLSHQAATCRAIALETLLSAIEEGRLLPGPLGQVLGQLLSTEFVPVQRFAETLAQARAIGPRPDDALRQLLEALLPLLPAEPLRNTKKLLELYADVLARGGYSAPEPVQARLQAWRQVSALKKTAAVLLAQGALEEVGAD